MADKDLGEELENIEEGVENLKNKEFKILGMKMTPMTIGAAITALGSVIGALYGGFLMYQKVEEVANLDVGAFEQRMELIEQKVTSVDDNIYAVKNDLKTDIRRIEDIVDDVERSTKQDLRDFAKDVKQIEKEFETKLRDALNNPLSDM